MKRRFRCPIQTKKEFVAEVLSGYRTEVVARKHGMAPKTLSNWVRQYQDEVDDLMTKKHDEAEKLKQDAAKLQEIEKKYSEAVKLLGEKELEINILRDLVKKKYPDWK
ncbi:transposase [Paenibacillus sp. GCM10027628]|uniref:transposase n=1 Tax=Paenibacillus sp. GCM10027628 TaxID=3273413 RepID=UPI0036306B97